ncbi:hypothetical protein [Endozoicomonas lisbonensis]|uniref:Nucleotide-diphospho-sugar transferase domain-containing protein n=1 Tax=Endozoicomonas lisbonensis TaxID=3120522 RepID=A0ABV2SJD2_9GAMM
MPINYLYSYLRKSVLVALFLCFSFQGVQAAPARVTETPCTEFQEIEPRLANDPFLATVEHPLVKIDVNRLDDPDYEAQLISDACRMIKPEDALEMVKGNMVLFPRGEKVPLPHALNLDIMKKSEKVQALITGATPFRDHHQQVCLNHLAYAVARGIDYYYFFATSDFEIVNDKYPHAMKLPAIISALKHVDDGRWVLWVDDDIVTSDFVQYHYYADMHRTRYSHSITPLADRAIDKAIDQRKEENRKITRQSDPCSHLKVKPEPVMIVTEDSQRARMNTGMIWIRNNNQAQELLHHWWNEIEADQPDEIKEPTYYCYKTDKVYESREDCLGNCTISKARSQLLCGPIKGWVSDINYRFYRESNSLYDQDVLKKLDEDTNRKKRHSVMDRLIIIPQRTNFIKGVDNVEEGLNAFYRTTDHGGENAKNPMIDKWVHFSGMSWEDKLEKLGIWMNNIKNYPMKKLMNGTETFVYYDPKYVIVYNVQEKERVVVQQCKVTYDPLESLPSLYFPFYIFSVGAAFYAGLYVRLKR